MKKTLLFVLLLGSRALWAQFPKETNSFAVTSPCPGSTATASSLQKINTDGSMTRVGTIRTAAGTELVINGLGYNAADRSVLYGIRVVTPTVASILSNTPPDLYRINLSTAQATFETPLTSPDTPPESELTPRASGETSLDLRQTLTFVADSDPNSRYYVGGVTFRVLAQSFFGFPNFSTARVTDVRLYVGTLNLTSIAPPTWNRLDISDPATAAVVEDFRVRTQAYIRSGFTGTVPDGGIQDWVYEKASGRLVSYLGQSGQYLTISNPASAPVGVTTTPTIPLPAVSNGSTDKNIGSMFSDVFNQVYVVRAATGEIHKIDATTGNYVNKSFGAALGCNRGDAVSFADALPLPVTLTRFAATATGETVRLTWATATEQAAAYFEAERSADGHTWEPAARVAASNRRDGSTYQAQDLTPLPGQSYYRLAMHDLDGRVAYSQIQTITRTRDARVVAYPNPAHEQLNVQLPDPNATAQLELLNAQGQRVWQGQSEAGAAQLRTTEFPAGFYLLRVRQAGATHTSRVVLAGH
ncbi:T9SS type A sorting domain-containing protein [Hymenobacter tenuis]